MEENEYLSIVMPNEFKTHLLLNKNYYRTRLRLVVGDCHNLEQV